MEYLGLLFLFATGAMFAQRIRWRWRAKRGKRQSYCPSGAAIGNALQSLQAFVQPEVRYVLQERLEEPAEDQEDGEPKDPREHLLRQARRIQRGEEVEFITAQWTADAAER